VFYLLHLANKAGNLKFGFQESVRMLEAKKAKLILLAQDLSFNTQKKIEHELMKNGTKYKYFSLMNEISKEMNRKETGILCIIDENFANGIGKLLGF
jgi:ribosomal protein L7Ae-like RNA K-turn-binding protein